MHVVDCADAWCKVIGASERFCKIFVIAVGVISRESVHMQEDSLVEMMVLT